MIAEKPITKFSSLKDARDTEWAKIIENSKWCDFVMNGDYDRRFYAIYLLETYHYVMHNPKHQALVATRFTEMPAHYAKFCYEHAEEEAGHELMAFHDLLNLGISKEDFEIPLPLPSTETFIAYLYRVSTTGNYLRRLGYSFWAEDSYQYIQGIMETVINKLNLTNKHTTFLVSHATIDVDHAAEIDLMIQKHCQTDEDWQAVEEVLMTSLKLQSAMLDDVVDEYLALKSGKKARYEFLNILD